MGTAASKEDQVKFILFMYFSWPPLKAVLSISGLSLRQDCQFQGLVSCSHVAYDPLYLKEITWDQALIRNFFKVCCY
jgi:hypothetical protein